MPEIFMMKTAMYVVGMGWACCMWRIFVLGMLKSPPVYDM